jgi:chromosome segregation protein
MRLEKIVLNGFKSFADKTEFTFDLPITGIVGPNGCGKSNVVDAVKWVLGEQSVKSLRSGQMADVIFSGSSSRKSAGMAEVSLVFGNTMGQLPIEADEVQITRRIYKSGECDYLINNKICRLKDIRELFMDTGVGVKAYSIIEQGQVDRLLTSSKTDRRDIFEEAAGISKYKAHKKEAIRKLEQTDQNLLRLADILGEVQKQLRSVKLAAGKARNYLEYTKKLKELQLNYSLAEYYKIDTVGAEKKAGLSQVEEQFAITAADVSRTETRMSELGNQIIEIENNINQTDNSLVSVQSKIEQQLQRIEFLKARITELQQRKDAAGARVEKLREQENIFCTELTQYKAEQENCEMMLQEKSSAAEELQKAITEVNAECTSLQADLEDEKSGIIDIVRRTAQLHNELQSISVYRSNLSSQKDRLAGRAESARTELEKLLTEKAQHTARRDDIDNVLIDLQKSLDTKRRQAEEITNVITESNKRLAVSKESKSALCSELAVLTDMENRCEGLNNAVKGILQSRSAGNGSKDYVEGLLADLVVADVEYAGAVEAALEGQTDAIVINSTGKLLDDAEMLEKLDGRVNFLSTDRIEPFVDKTDLTQFSGARGRVVEFVKYQGRYAPLVWKLLGKTIIADSMDAAVKLSEMLGDEYRFVTLKGEFLTANGIIKLGPLGRATGLISRKSRVRQLQETIGNITAEIADTEEHIEKSKQTSTHLEKLCKDLRTAVYEANTEKMQVGSKLTIYEQNIKRLTEEQPLIAGEIGLLEEQIAQSVKKEYDSKQKLQELEAVNNERKTRIAELQARYDQQKSQQTAMANKLTELKVAIGQITEKGKALKQTITSVQNQLNANQATTDAAQAEIENCTKQSEQATRDILACETSVSELFAEKETRQRDSISLHTQAEKLFEEQKQTEQLIRQKRAQQTEIDQRMNQLKMDLRELEVKQQGLIERTQQELQIDLKQAFENYQDKQVDWDAVREEMTELRGRIERLGNVNIDSINEQEELEKRNEFLSRQVEDLNNSQAQLQQLITRLNKQSREKFRETFEQIRVNFQEIFRKLFGGGKADIMLEDAEDILEAGIEIMAKPPGKETRSISLLSGGEKTMTAIALLFAVFKSKPSPFCMLDEVDAALDEANNERFNLLVREFQKGSQFIVITHSKRTMSIADMLYGITMQTRGVSKKISVKFGEYEPEAEKAAVA